MKIFVLFLLALFSQTSIGATQLGSYPDITAGEFADDDKILMIDVSQNSNKNARVRDFKATFPTYGSFPINLSGSLVTGSLPASSLSGAVSVSNGGTGSSTVSANRIFAGPASGGAAAPSFRALSITDLPSISFANTIYVDKNGSDSSCAVGSVLFPCLTVSHAMTLVTSPTTSNRYRIMLGAGTFTETVQINLKPWTWIIGTGASMGGVSRISVTASGNKIAADPSWSAGSQRGGLMNLYLTGSTNIEFDRQAIAGVGSTVLELFNIGVNGSITFKANTSGLDFLDAVDIRIFGALNMSGGSLSMLGSILNSNVVVDNSGTQDFTGDISGTLIAGNITATQSGANTLALRLHGGDVSGTITESGSADVVSVGEAYLAATPSNWTTLPDDVMSAIDGLAATGLVKAQVQKTFFAGPSSGADANPAFRAIVATDLPSIPTTALSGSIDLATQVSGSLPITALPEIFDNHVIHVGALRTHKTIQSALTAVGNATTAAQVKEPWTIMIEPGIYDENLTIPQGRIITLYALGTVVLGNGAGANWASTNSRSITFTANNADVFGSDIKPALNIVALPAADPTTTFIAESGAFFISGNLNVAGDGLSHTINLNSVKIAGAVSKTAAGLTNIQGYRWYQIGVVSMATATILERCFECEFDALVTVDGYNAIINSEINAGMTVATNFNTMPPSGFFNTTFFGTFTGPASSLKLDPVSNYYFTQNGATLGGSATKVLLGLVDVSSQTTGSLPSTAISGVLGVSNGGTGKSSWSDGFAKVVSGVFSSVSALTLGTDVVGSINAPSVAYTPTDPNDWGPDPVNVLEALDALAASIPQTPTGITQLTGDVTAGPGSGSVAATVSLVGGKSAAAVATSVDDTIAATSSNTISTIVKRDSNGDFSARIVNASLATTNLSGQINLGTQVTGSLPSTHLSGTISASLIPTLDQLLGDLDLSSQVTNSLPVTYLSGVLSASQVPALSALSGQLNLATQTTGILAAANVASIPLTTGVSGLLPVGNGGTGVSTSSANQVFAGPVSGGAAAPSFRALDPDDIPGLDVLNGLLSLSSQVTGSLPSTALSGTVAVANGGTAKSSWSDGFVKVSSNVFTSASQVNLSSEVTGSLPVTHLSGTVDASQIPALSALSGLLSLSTQVTSSLPVTYLSGTLAASQVPALSALNGQISLATQVSGSLPVTALSGQLVASQVPDLSALNGLLNLSSQVTSSLPVSYLSGTVAASQIPALSALSGQISLATQVTASLPTTHLSGTVAASQIPALSLLSGQLDLSSQVTGSLPVTRLSGTIAAANIPAINLSTMTTGSLPAGNVSYTPSDSSKWGPDPVNVYEALNVLAASIPQTPSSGGDVSTGGTATKLCYGFFNNGANDVTTDPTNCVSSITDNANGDITVNFTSSYFSGNVVCTCSALSGGTDGLTCQIGAAGTTTHRFKVYDSTATLADFSFTFQCFGSP